MTSPYRTGDDHSGPVSELAALRGTRRARHGGGVVPTTLDGLPLMLTVEEAAKVLRVGRTTAYKLAEEWRITGGRSGLPAVKLGRRLLVRRIDLADIVGWEPPA